MRFSLSYSYFSKLLLIVFFIAEVFLLKYGEGIIRYILNITMISAVLLMLLFNKFNRNTVDSLLLLLGGMVIWYLIVSTYKDSFHYSLFISFLSSLIAAYIFVFSRDRIEYLFFVYRVFFIGLCFLFVWLIIGNDPNELVAGSRNTISLVLVGIGAMFLIDKEFYPKLKYGFVFYALIFFICILSIGRSGIITSGMLLFAYILLNYKKNTLSFFLINILAVCLVFLFFSGFLISIIGDVEYFNYFQSRGIVDEYRSNMISEYFKDFNVTSLFMGQDISKLPYIMSFNANPHNSYLNYHSKLGFSYVLIVACVLIYFFQLILQFNFVAALALLAVLLRLFTDSVSDVSILSLVFALMLFFKNYQSFFNPSLQFKKTIKLL